MGLSDIFEVTLKCYSDIILQNITLSVVVLVQDIQCSHQTLAVVIFLLGFIKDRVYQEMFGNMDEKTYNVTCKQYL